MHRLVPDFIIEQFAAGNYSGHFRAAALFVDISGFSSLTDQLMSHGQHGAEVLAAIIRAVFEPLMQSVYMQGGFVVTLAGDAFTALFPLDSQEGGYTKALAAAWIIQKRMSEVAQQTTPAGTFSLSIKVGAADGVVDWGIVRSDDDRRAAYYFRGAAIDDCSAAEHLAEPGQTILSSSFYQAIRRLVVAEWINGTSEQGDYYRVSEITGLLPIPGDVNLPPVNLSATSRFYPSTLVTQPHSGEFRHVVNLFIRLPTVRTEVQLAIFMQSLFALQDRYGGQFNRLDFSDKGSHLLLFWGAPLTHENDIERALNLILDLQTQTSIPIIAGVTYHIAHAGFIGSSLREEYTCFGRGINLAARFMTQAGRGEIWLDEAVAQRAKQHFDLDFEGVMDFKGFSEPQQVYVLYERQEQFETLFQGQLVGRQEELNTLNDFIAPLIEGQFAGVMLITGEGGIGKSRLVYEYLADQANQALGSYQLFLAQSDEILQSALAPFRYWLRHYFEQSDSQSEARNKRAFNRALDRLIGLTKSQALARELDRTRSFLGALMNLHWPDSLYEELEPQGRHENTFLGLLSLLQAESLQQPVILHLEDAHWMDEASRTFLDRLVGALTADDQISYPIALIIAARPTGHPILPIDLAYQQIHLTNLTDDQLARLTQDQLGEAAVSKLRDLVAERSEGNPFFAEQILRYLKGQNLLVLEADGWSLAQRPDAMLLPTNVRAVLVARLDQLTQDVKEVVQTAAVLGREFEIRLLSLMLQDSQNLPGKLDQAEKDGIWALLSELRYIFRHALLRDAAYQMQLLTHRQKLHDLALTSMEGLHAQDLTLHAGELAYHAEQAGRLDKARLYLQQAGDAAKETYENNLAIDYYTRALTFVPEDETGTRSQLLLAREDVWNLLGERDRQQDDLMMLIDLAKGSDDLQFQSEIALRRARYAGAIGDHQAAIGAAQDAVKMALDGGHTELAARGYRRWGWYLMRQTAYDEARQQLEQALDQALRAQKTALEADCLNALGALAMEIGDYAAASTYYQQARERYQQSGDKIGEGSTWNNQGGVAYAQGKYADAILHYEYALEIRRLIGARRAEGNTLYNLGAANRNLGYYAKARACHERSLVITRQVGDRRGEGLVLNSLGILASNLGAYATARDNCEKSLGIFQEIGDRMLMTNAHTNLGRFAVDQDRFGEAEEHYQSALNLARETGRQLDIAFAQDGLGWAKLGLSQPDEAASYFEASIEIWEALDRATQKAETKSGLARVALAQRDLQQAGALIDELLSELDSQSMAGSERLSDLYLTCVRVLEVRQDPRATAVLEQAHTKLLEQAEKITDPDEHKSFLLNIPYHRQLIEAYEKLQARTRD